MSDPFAGAVAARKLPPHAVKTYEIAMPRDTHTRPATCAEAECQARANGWVTIADETTPEGAQIAAQVRRLARPTDAVLSPVVAARVRRYTLTVVEGVSHFAFGPGQECFTPHRVKLERQGLYIVREGDYRGNPRGGTPFHHRTGAEWVEDSALHQQALAAAHQKG
jgi:hypothetical protein